MFDIPPYKKAMISDVVQDAILFQWRSDNKLGKGRLVQITRVVDLRAYSKDVSLKSLVDGSETGIEIYSYRKTDTVEGLYTLPEADSKAMLEKNVLDQRNRLKDKMEELRHVLAHLEFLEDLAKKTL